MKNSYRSHLSRIMRAAWNLAKMGAQRFGGSVKLYFTIALRLIWAENRTRTVWRKGNGLQFVLPGLPLKSQVSKRGQIMLPGVYVK